MISKNRNRIYSNGEITIVWRASECTHSTICYTRLRSVFDPIKRPWINASGASTAEILAIIESCPSSALSFYWNDDSRNAAETSSKIFRGDVEHLLGHKPMAAEPSTPPPTSNVTVNIRANGPVVISGNFTTITADGQPMSAQMLSLCRCGQSGNMPHCDGSHFKIGFKSN